MDTLLHTLVTGASSGLGRSAAVRLSRERNLILHGRNRERLEETLRMCLHPERHVVWEFDLKHPGELAGSLTPLLAASGRAVESFVHCAGMVTALPMRSVDYSVAQEIMNVNFFSAAEIVHVLLKRKVNGQRLTDILFISSIWSRFGARAHSAYCASKAAERFINDGLRQDLLGTPIRVTSVNPGMVETEFSLVRFHGNQEQAAKVYKNITPLTPEDVADAIVWAATRPEHVNIARIGLTTVDQANSLLFHRTA